MEPLRVTINSWVLCVGGWRYPIDPKRPIAEQLDEALGRWRDSEERPGA